METPGRHPPVFKQPQISSKGSLKWDNSAIIFFANCSRNSCWVCLWQHKPLQNLLLQVLIFIFLKKLRVLTMVELFDSRIIWSATSGPCLNSNPVKTANKLPKVFFLLWALLFWFLNWERKEKALKCKHFYIYLLLIYTVHLVQKTFWDYWFILILFCVFIFL